MNINNIIQHLNEINNSLGEIYTNGDNSILLVRCRYQIASLIDELKNNEDKKE